MNSWRPAVPYARLSADRGIYWLKDAFAMLSLSRIAWLTLLLSYYLILGVIDVIPVLGQIAAPILKPVY